MNVPDQQNTLLKKIHGIVIVFLFLFSNICLARRERIDSLKKVLLVLNDSPRINCRNALSSAYALYKTDSEEIFAKQDIREVQKDDVLCCKITDDGIGRIAAELKIKSASIHKSMGMCITADRIAMLQQKK